MTERKRRCFLQGSYTIEASLLFPLFIFIIVLIVYLSFFLYDRVLFYNCAYLSAFRASSNNVEDNENAYEVAKNTTNDLLENRMLAIQTFGDRVSVGNGKTVVEYQGDMPIPFQFINILFSQHKMFVVSGIGSAKKIDPVSFIRSCRKIEAAAITVREGVENDIP